MKKILLTTLAIAGLTLSGAAFAQTASITGDTSFDGVDTDRNGGVSWAEFSLVFTDISEAQFNTADLNKDGVLQPEEFDTIAMSTGSIAPRTDAELPAGVDSLTYDPGDDAD